MAVAMGMYAYTYTGCVGGGNWLGDGQWEPCLFAASPVRRNERPLLLFA